MNLLGRKVTDGKGNYGEVVDTLSPFSELVRVQWDDQDGESEMLLDELGFID